MRESIFVPPEYAGAQAMPMPRVITRGQLDDDPVITAPPSLTQHGVEGLLVGLDVDGTLLSKTGHIDRELIDALRELEARGAHIVVATGRSIPAAMPLLATLGLSGEWAICSNGAVTIRTAPDDEADRLGDGATPTDFGVAYTVADQVMFDPTEAIDRLVMALPQALIGVEAVGRGFRVSRPFPDGELIGEQIVEPIERLKAEPVSRVIARAPDMERDDFYHAVATAGLHSIPWDVGWTSWLDISPPQTTKAAALQSLADSLGVPRGHSVAVGDGTNDKTMIEWAGWGIAMGQAADAVKSVADTISSSVERGGARRIIEALLKISSV